jgi:integral membrane protein
MQNTAITRFRKMGLLEGGSLLVLVFIAMPLKYWAGFPEAVWFVGSLHGFLFVLYVLMIIYTTFKVRWSFLWTVSALAAAFIPFGNMVLDRFLQRTFTAKEVS